MITKKTVVDQIEIRPDGTIQLRLGLLLMEGGNELQHKWHRTVLPPGADLDVQIAEVNKHLVEMGQDPVDLADVERVRAIMPAVHTAEAVATYEARLAQPLVPGMKLPA